MLGELYAGFQGMFGVQPLDDNVHITGSPLYHTAVLMWTANSLHMGHTVVLMDKWTPEGMLELIEQHKVTTSHMVPTQFHRLLALPEDVRAKYDVSSLRCMVHAAAPCPPDVKRKMIEWWGDAIMEYYAATEGGGSIITAKEWLEKPGSVGKAWPGASSASSTTTATRCRPAPRAPCTCRSPRRTSSTRATRRRPKRTVTTGFFTVGDWGLLDEDGYLFLKDRKSDMIISGGVNIYPAEIESTFCSPCRRSAMSRCSASPTRTGARRSRPWSSPPPVSKPDDALRDEIFAFCQDKLAEVQAAEDDRLHRPRCRVTRTASSTSASCATRTGKASSARSEPAQRLVNTFRASAVELVLGHGAADRERLAPVSTKSTPATIVRVLAETGDVAPPG